MVLSGSFGSDRAVQESKGNLPKTTNPMGVQNLWMLLAPVGRQIEIETLASNVLAVDASIWLTQFIKAMRDDDGNMIKNAHLIGTFHRVAKLLFYRIRPVFVFDGNTPEIKKRTVARRRRRQENQTANLKQTAQRILLNRLKLYREELKKNGGRPVENSAVAPNFLLPGADADDADTERKEEEVITIDDSEEADDSAVHDRVAGSGTKERTRSISEVADGVVDLEEAKSDGDEDGEDMTADDIVLDTSRLSRIDLDAVFALPGHLQKDMIARIQRDRRQEAREQFIPLAGNPEAYSRSQISSFLKTSQLNRQIMKARKKNAQLEMKKAAAEAADEAAGLHGNGQRIASSRDRFFVYQKSQGRESDDESIDDANEGTQGVLDVNEAAKWQLSGSLEVPAEAEADEDIFDRIHGSKRKRRYLEEDTIVVKKSLADFSVDSVQDFTTEMSRVQRRKIAVEEARRKFMEKAKTEQQPEQSHQSEPFVSVDSVVDDAGASLERGDQITITFKEEDLETLDEKAKSLFPSSVFKAFDQPDIGSKPAQREDEDKEGEDIDWEDVPSDKIDTIRSEVSTTIEKVDSTKGNESEKGSDEVRRLHADTTLTNEATVKESDSIIRLDEDSEEEIQWEEVADDVSIVKSAIEIPEEVARSPTTTADLDNVDGDAEIDPEVTDLYSSMRSELDDERAEEDLSALRAEAIQSAIATASNLTQWAAGAVRRALAQHAKGSDIKRIGSTSERASPTQIPSAMNVAPGVIDLAEVEAVNTEESVVTDDQVTSDVVDGKDSEDHLLQQAIEQSIETAKHTASKNASTRYLQYAASPQPEPPVDMAAIEDEQKELKKLRNRQMRDTEGVNDEMVQDVMELLSLFGVPYLVCPMEAEAQCAALEQLGLVDGIITDDSDIFPFGGRKVYKNIFHNQKFVEAFFADDVEKELGFSQDEMIALAMLLGSDYTDGVRGIGIVNASEVVAAYPGLDGLKEFKQWVHTFDVAEEARRRLEKKKSQAEIDAMTPRERFEYTHASVRRKWELGDEFPNHRVIHAYKSPQVDRSDSRFSWELPNLAGLREYCTRTFGWDQSKTDTVLLPLMEQIASFANERHRQTRIDQFFTKYDDNVKYAKIQSKRLRSAVEDKTGTSHSVAGNDKSKSPAKKPKAPAKVAVATKFTKKKKTTSTLGL